MTFVATRRACYTGLAVQAIVNNLAPLLFIVFHTEFSIPVAELGGLAALNFGVQLLTDLVAMRVVDKVGYRRPVLLAHVMSVAGLVLLAVLPRSRRHRCSARRSPSWRTRSAVAC